MRRHAIMSLFWAAAALAFLVAHVSADEYHVPDAPAEYLSQKNPYFSAKDIKYGKRQYMSKCADCHGDEGEGDPEEPEVVVFKDGSRMKTRPDGQLFYIIQNGAGPDAEMEAFGAESDYGFSDKKIWKIIAFIRTLAEE